MSDSAFTQSSTLLTAIRAVLPTLAVAYLFGSASRDGMRRDSDVDVAVEVGRELALTELWNAARALSLALSRDVDLIDFRAASIERAVSRAREEYVAAGATFATDRTREDAAILNVQRSCETTIDLAQHGVRVRMETARLL